MGSDRFHWDLVSDADDTRAQLAAARARVADLERENAGLRANVGVPSMLHADALRGLVLILRHLDEGGHDWRDGTAIADVEAARVWLAGAWPRLTACSDSRRMTVDDLSDAEIEGMADDDRLPTMRLHRMALEIRRHRATQRADAERVKAVVKKAVTVALADGMVWRSRAANVVDERVVDALAERVAEQLASASPVLSSGEKDHLGSLLCEPVLADYPLARQAIARLLGGPC